MKKGKVKIQFMLTWIESKENLTQKTQFGKRSFRKPIGSIKIAEGRGSLLVLKARHLKIS